MERMIEPEAFGKSGDTYYHRNKWRHYESGVHSPQRRVREKADQVVDGSADGFDHLLWTDALPIDRPLGDRIDPLLKTLGPDVQQAVFAPATPGATRSHIRRPVDGRLFRKLENHAGMDALACLTILLREAHEQGHPDRAFKIGLPLFWVLLIFCTTCSAIRIRSRLFELYRSEIFPLAATQSMRYQLDDYPLLEAASLLSSHALAAEDCGSIGLGWNDTVRYMMKLLRGNMGLDLRITFLPTIEDDGRPETRRQRLALLRMAQERQSLA